MTPPDPHRTEPGAGVAVRGMAEGDAEALHAIHGACLTATLLGRGHYTREQVEAWMAGRTPEGYLNAARGGERFLVAERDGAVVGFASWRDGELLSLFIHPDHQGRGIGSALAFACSAEAERSGAPITVVRAALGAEPFYRRHGLAVVGPGAAPKRGVGIPHTRMRRDA
ncbi:MAG: GNAT family N-acetyltransferase [Acetobacteraceae bacterium]|nr:GNAT family N-acetyltransferase [Acetobacteraceae bacterium]